MPQGDLVVAAMVDGYVTLMIEEEGRDLAPCIGNGSITQSEEGRAVVWLGQRSRQPGPRWAVGCLVPRCTDHLFHVARAVAYHGGSGGRSRRVTQPIASPVAVVTPPAASLPSLRLSRPTWPRREDTRGLPVAPRPPRAGLAGRLRRQAPKLQSRVSPMQGTKSLRVRVLWPPTALSVGHTSDDRAAEPFLACIHTAHPPSPQPLVRPPRDKKIHPHHLFSHHTHTLSPPKLSHPAHTTCAPLYSSSPHEVYVLELPLQRPQLSPVS